MRIVIPGVGPAWLDAAEDFGRFSIALDAIHRDSVESVLGGIGELADGDHVWIRPDAVRILSPLADKPDWETDFRKMLAFAGSRGWLGPAGEVRAHIEFVDATACSRRTEGAG